MNVVCLDLEGVLVPEIWIAFAKASGIPELERTTRDEPDYDKLMNFRLDILREHGLGLAEIQDVIATIDPMEGAREFLDALREKTQVIIISDTIAAGDSYNDLGMIRASKAGWLFKGAPSTKAENPDVPTLEEYDELLAAIESAL